MSNFFSVKDEQAGAVALFTVLLLTVILTILTLGFVRQTIVEQRLATDDDLSARAYFAAEAGLEDARIALKTAQGEFLDALGDSIPADATFQQYLIDNYNAEDCAKDSISVFDPVVSEANDLDMEYTCLKMTARDDFTDRVDPDGEVTFTVFPDNAEVARVAWHKLPEGDPADPVSYKANDGPIGSLAAVGVPDHLYRKDTWVNTYQWPALMTATVFYLDNDELEAKTAYFYPHEEWDPLNAPPSAPTPGVGARFDRPGERGFEVLFTTKCDPNAGDGQYACWHEITNLPPDVLGISLAPLYRTTTVNVEAYDDTSNYNVVEVGGQVDVDVTGRSGAAFRRIVATIDLSLATLVEEYNLPEENVIENILSDHTEAIVSGESLCKTFITTDTPINYDENNGGLEWCAERDD